jgi:mannose-6-phosphate isomerase-like protein (cupin superfamily)
MNGMNTLHSFVIDNTTKKVTFVETQEVKEGVRCDIYTIKGKRQDLAIVTVTQGYKTPLQRVLLGDRTIEGFISGSGALTVTSPDGTSTVYEFSNENEGNAVVVTVGQLMQWHACGPVDLIFYEICEPPYEDGRFENLAEQ